MLVLSRHSNETVIITLPGTGQRVVMTVVEMRGDKVRLGWDAPIEVEINRGEIQDKIDAGLGYDNPRGH